VLITGRITKMLNISKTIENGTAIFKLEGKLDTLTSPKFVEAVKASIDDVQELILDLGNLKYISSAGLRAIMLAEEEMESRGTMKLINVSGMTLEVLQVTGIADWLNIE
jgi:anti-sigma B factor antagonist